MLPHLEPIIVEFNSDCDSDVDTPCFDSPRKRYTNGLKQRPAGVRTSDLYLPSECPTPYPPSTSSDSESESESDSDTSAQWTSTQSRFEEASQLQASIASASEVQLRHLVAKLAKQSLGFQQAVARELRVTPTEDPTTPVERVSRSPPSRSPRRGRRRPRRASAPQPSRHRQSQLDRCQEAGALGYDECGRRVYHPGRLVKDVYEFLSTTMDGRPSKALETITMWSCCDQEALMPGCRPMTRSLDDSETEVMAGRHP